jgi:hypothetical protein
MPRVPRKSMEALRPDIPASLHRRILFKWR